MKDYHQQGGISRMNQMTKEEKSAFGRKGILERFNPSVPKATHSGILQIGDKKIECAVLKMPDGTIKRVISAKSILKIMGRSNPNSKDMKTSRATNVPVFLVAKNLSPFLSLEDSGATSPVIYKNKSGCKTTGYECSILPLACDIYLQARKAKVLTHEQIELAESCEALLRSFARVGLVALIDECSGYQEVRDRFALQTILDKYLRTEFAEWAKRFPPSFYKEIFRLNDWKFAEISTKKPMIIGKYTNDIVYSRLLPELVDELQSRNPKNEEGYRLTKHHQWLSEIGNIDLEKHISAVTALMRCCSNWKEFKELLSKVYPVKSAKDILIKE